MGKLTFEWVDNGDGSQALVFDVETWTAYEKVASAQGQTAHQLISTAVAACFGSVVENNYALNRFLRSDDPDFLRLNKKLK
jgi:hypothetical protein